MIAANSREREVSGTWETAMGFSERMGFKSPRTILQTDSMDEGLRAGLWNVFYMMHDGWTKRVRREKCLWFYRMLWHNFFREQVDKLDRP